MYSKNALRKCIQKMHSENVPKKYIQKMLKQKQKIDFLLI